MLGYGAAGQNEVPDIALQEITGWTMAYLWDRCKGQVHCWGCNGMMSDVGQCDSPTEVTSFSQILAGSYHGCALQTDGTVLCWGCEGNRDHGRCDVPAGTFTKVDAGVGPLVPSRKKAL